jgi:hypothetical protein
MLPGRAEISTAVENAAGTCLIAVFGTSIRAIVPDDRLTTAEYTVFV